MMFFLLAAIGIGAFYTCVYRKFSYKAKFYFKMVWIYLSLVIVAFSVTAVVYSVKEAYESELDKSLSKRINWVQHYVTDGEYNDLAGTMELYQDYEPEFEYLWERVEMYECCNRYLIFAAEGDTKEAEEYKNRLLSLAKNPDYRENAAYGKYFLKRAGIEAE